MAETHIEYSLHPELLSRQLGRDMYKAPEALKQLIANALDADSSRVDVTIYYNDMETPSRVVISDDGRGIPPADMLPSFGKVGIHAQRPGAKREAIGTRGIGRFAVYSLAAETRWSTVSDVDGERTQLTWTMTLGDTGIRIHQEEVSDLACGTTIDMTLLQTQDAVALFSSPQRVRRALFNSFAGYVSRYEKDVELWIAGEQLLLDDFVDERVTESIGGHDDVPEAELHHMVLGSQVEQIAPSVLVFATHGTTVIHEVLGDEGIPNRKYLGLIDSPYLSDLTNTSKSDLADFDPQFQALKEEAKQSARGFIAERQGELAQDFLEHARKQEFYPYREPPKTPVDTYRRQLYDGLLLTLEETIHIGKASLPHQKLIFALTRQLMQSEDLASVLTNVLGLTGDEVSRFASLLRRTSLSSIIAVADLLVARLQFLEELNVLLYGEPAKWVRERSQLHKILEGHTWLFGEEYHLMGSDKRMDTLMRDIPAKLGLVENDDEQDIPVDPSLRDVPDLFLSRTKWHEGAKYHQHLVIELKRPSVRITLGHVEQATRYATKIVNSPIWSQKADKHRFTFVVVSADITASVKIRYQADSEPGLVSRLSLDHPTELWALRWSDYLDLRREELKFLEEQIEITADPELLEYLKRRVGDLLPPELPS
ncbi:MAG: ATP-binding protein [Dehalococcoidia bacterium]